MVLDARIRTAALAAVLAAICAAPEAFAASAGSDGMGNVHFTADASDDPNDVTVSVAPGGIMINDAGNSIDSGSCDGDGTNTVVCSGSRLTVNLGEDDDLLELSVAALAFGGEGADQIMGSHGNDTLHGGEASGTVDGADTIDGRGGADTITGGPGNDVLRGGDGDDLVQSAPDSSVGDGADSFAGGSGRDTFQYQTPAGVIATLDDQPNDGLRGGAEGDNVRSDVEALVGSASADSLGGNDGANTLDGAGGDDVLQAGAGEDTLTGGPGRDELSGGLDNDSLSGGSASGVFGDSADALNGDGGNDSLSGGDGDDMLSGGDGSDLIEGGPGVDRGSWESARAPVSVTLDDQANDGELGEGDFAAPDVEDVAGGDDENTLTGSASANTLTAGGAEDYVDGDAGADTLIAGASGDTVRSRDGTRDVVECGDGPDFVIADANDSPSGECELVDRGGPPRLGRRVTVIPSANAAQGAPPVAAMRLPQVRRFVPLRDRVNVPVRSRLDARATTLRLQSVLRRRGRRRLQSARVSGVRFRMTQPRRSGFVNLALKGGDFSACSSSRRRGGASAAQRRVVRRLRGRARGRFRTRGRHSSATVRGTRWVMEDRCDGTLTRVRSGVVVVRDFAKRRTVRLRRGQTYLARPRRR